MVIWLHGSVLLFLCVRGSVLVAWLFWGVMRGGAWFDCVVLLGCGGVVGLVLVVFCE